MSEIECVKEIRIILKRVEDLLKEEQRYNYELSEAHTEVENELKYFIGENELEEYTDENQPNIDVMNILEKAKKLQCI
ncbi:hypothetical protein CN372_05070 [Bacillus anthracis]|nr:hypothetical protein CN372_05070 [Bacillus anthracis]